MSSPHHWQSLLAWLAGRGLNTENIPVEARSAEDTGYGMFALREIAPSTPLFTIPANALLNSINLSPHYPKTKPELSSTEIISLHLLLHRPSAGISLDPLFGPYISILPDNFDAHPLTWYWEQRYDPANHVESIESKLLAALPSFVAHDLRRVADTFHSCWERISAYLREHPMVLRTHASNPRLRGLESTSLAVFRDYLWAWLNVNTRCIHYRVKKAKGDPNNLTLCPVLDFANHTARLPSMLRKVSGRDLWGARASIRTGEDFTLLSPAETTVLPNEELFLRYGYHSNQTLFVEYGFVNDLSGEMSTNNTGCGDVDISPAFERLFVQRGEVGRWMRSVLEAEGYWGEWTIHSFPTPAHPSYRLITALRLYHTVPWAAGEGLKDGDEMLEIWRDTVNGKRDVVSVENESLWRRTLSDLCQGIAGTAASRVSEFQAEVQQRGGTNGASWESYMIKCIVTLWMEEMSTARAVVDSIEQDVVF